mgnify:CR=1 FL=1
MLSEAWQRPTVDQEEMTQEQRTAQLRKGDSAPRLVEWRLKLSGGKHEPFKLSINQEVSAVTV